ncbi:MAG: VCBS repeat-containing protein [Pyrinomonadaceae bacterium]|nr:VCBS repeat-containing protein [Pyrinomonadaceae bacterium]
MPRSAISKLRLIFLLAMPIMTVVCLMAQTINAQCARPGFKLAYGNFSNAAEMVIARDFNSDNKADIATISPQTGKMTISLGDGLGGFTSQAVYLVGSGFFKIVSGDINGDGKLDLMLASGTSSFPILLNNGSGGFGFPINLSLPTSYEDLRIIDFNGDGKGDLLSGYRISNTPLFQIRIGDGAGNFTAPFNYFIDNTRGFVAGDFNGDGKKDVAVIFNDPATRTLRLYLNDGSGVLVAGTPINLGTDTLLVAARDFNGDGKDDLIARTPPTNAVTMLLNNGSGGFTRSDHPLFATINEVAVADFNGDGKLDVITSHYNPTNSGLNAALLFGDGLGGFTRNDYQSGVRLGWTYAGDMADFNGDNMADIVVPNWATLWTQGGVRIWHRTCNLNINTRRTDYTGDGQTDYAVWRPSNGNWIIRTLSGSYITRQWGGGSFGDVPVPGDYDGDNKTDLAVFRAPAGIWYVLRSSDDSYYGVQWGLNGDKPVPGDYDADGKTDLAVFRPSNGGWYILNSSNNTLSSHYFGTEGDKPAQADFDGDDKTDVAVFRPSNGTWYMLKSSDGSFFYKHWGQDGDRPLPGDYDGDGKADIAVYRAASALFYLRSWDNSSAAMPDSAFYGTPSAEDRPAHVGTYDFAEVVMWRPASGFFGGIFNSTSGPVGTFGDIPVTTPYVVE